MIHRFGERSCRRGLPIGGDHPRLRTEGEPASIAAEGDGRAGAVADEHALAAAVEVEKVKGAAANLGEPELGVHRAVRQRAPVLLVCHDSRPSKARRQTRRHTPRNQPRGLRLGVARARCSRPCLEWATAPTEACIEMSSTAEAPARAPNRDLVPNHTELSKPRL
jgi:hypothetical protein